MHLRKVEYSIVLDTAGGGEFLYLKVTSNENGDYRLVTGDPMSGSVTNVI